MGDAHRADLQVDGPAQAGHLCRGESGGEGAGLGGGLGPILVNLKREGGPALVSVEPLQRWSCPEWGGTTMLGGSLNGETQACPGESVMPWMPGQKGSPSLRGRQSHCLLDGIWGLPTLSKCFPDIGRVTHIASSSPGHATLEHAVPGAWGPLPLPLPGLSCHPFMPRAGNTPRGPPCLQDLASATLSLGDTHPLGLSSAYLSSVCHLHQTESSWGLRALPPPSQF